jgi:hypothetical protein
MGLDQATGEHASSPSRVGRAARSTGGRARATSSVPPGNTAPGKYFLDTEGRTLIAASSVSTGSPPRPLLGLSGWRGS